MGLLLLGASAAAQVPDTLRRPAPDTAARAVTDTLPVAVDTLNRVAAPVADKPAVDSVLRVHSPRKAILRSAMIPGWGQAYNRRYWKIPIVYGALGVTAGVFVDNLKWYRRTRLAYTILATKDSARFPLVHERLQVFIERNAENSLRLTRDQFRRNLDYSVLFFLFFWGLNVVDAAVDAHLRSFDVSPDLSLRLRGGYSDMAGTNGLSLVFTFK